MSQIPNLIGFKSSIESWIQLRKILTIITVTAYDHARLKTTIGSICDEFVNLEHLLVTPMEDGLSREIALEYKSRIGHSVRIFHDTGKGIYHAMNLGASNARGDYITFWNSGDFLNSSQNLTKIIASLAKSKAHWMITQEKPNKINKKILDESQLFGFITHKKGNFISHQNIFVKRTKFLEIGGFATNLKVAADFKQITQLSLGFKPQFLDISAVGIEAPKYSAVNHRRGRIESYIISWSLLKKKMKFMATVNIIRKEINYLTIRMWHKKK